MKRGGAWYSTLATQLLNAHYNDLGETHIVNVPQRGAVPGWPADWVLEMPARVSRAGVEPLPAEPLPPVCFGLLAAVKSYELLTVEAAVHGDRKAPTRPCWPIPSARPPTRYRPCWMICWQPTGAICRSSVSSEQILTQSKKVVKRTRVE